MKKTLLAAALLAGFAGAVHAQSTSVTLYGIVDAGVAYTNVKASKNTIAANNIFGSNKTSGSRIGMISGQNSGSRWGLRGSEDLGDGLRAVFQLESGFSVRAGQSGQNGNLFGRHATVGLASDSWGQLDFGRQLTLGNKYFGDIDPFGTSFSQFSLDHGFSAAGIRWDNLVLYRTPDIAGFQAGIGYSFATDNTNANATYKTGNNTRGLTTGVRYLNGPLNVVVTYDQMRGKRQTVGNAKPKMYALGVTYDLEVVKLAAAYARTTDGWFGGSSTPEDLPNLYGTQFAKGFKAHSTMLGLTAPIDGNSRVFTSWQRIKPNNARLSVAAVGNIANVTQSKTVNIYAAGYTYDFSRRTNLYTYAGYISNFGFISGTKGTEVGVGLRHRF